MRFLWPPRRRVEAAGEGGEPSAVGGVPHARPLARHAPQRPRALPPVLRREAGRAGGGPPGARPVGAGGRGAEGRERVAQALFGRRVQGEAYVDIGYV